MRACLHFSGDGWMAARAGLTGLSISHDITVKQHGGSVEVDTKLGEFAEFRLVLSRTGASLIKSGERGSR
jgi:hypothetical protein